MAVQDLEAVEIPNANNRRQDDEATNHNHLSYLGTDLSISSLR